MFELNDKVALVTGASRGIGQAIARQLAEAGAYVVGTSRSQAGADHLTALFSEAGLAGRGVVLDVTDTEQLTALHTELKTADQSPLIVVNNAGITQDNLLLRMKPEQWEQVINTNLNSVFYNTKLALKPMIKARWGRIINITSVGATAGNPGQANYCAAKAGMIGFSKALALEMAGCGITVNCIAPGYIDTDMTRRLNEKQQAAVFDYIPMKRIGQPIDIAYAAQFLASQAASYMTGQTLHVNGGLYVV